MDKVDFTFKRGGRTKSVTSAQAKVLSRAGLGTYETRDMARQPTIVKPMVAAPVASLVHEPVSGDNLDGMDKEQLHALAKERGVKVHALAGADKVRAALRGHQE